MIELIEITNAECKYVGTDRCEKIIKACFFKRDETTPEIQNTTAEPPELIRRFHANTCKAEQRVDRKSASHRIGNRDVLLERIHEIRRPKIRVFAFQKFEAVLQDVHNK